MIVADASVFVDMFLGLGGQAGDELARRLARKELISAPHLLDAEVGQALRGLCLRGRMTVDRARASLQDLQTLPVRRYPHTRLLYRAFELRDNVTVYDGLYLALAEALDVPLLSCDAAMANVPGCAASVEVLPVWDGGAAR